MVVGRGREIFELGFKDFVIYGKVEGVLYLCWFLCFISFMGMV